MFEGAHTALVTPFANNGIDSDAFRALIDRQIAAGIAGVVPVESGIGLQYLSTDERPIDTGGIA